MQFDEEVAAIMPSCIEQGNHRSVCTLKTPFSMYSQMPPFGRVLPWINALQVSSLVTNNSSDCILDSQRVDGQLFSI